MSYDYLLKCIVVGDTAVGKSCLLLQFTEQRFQNAHDITVGVEFGTRTIEVRDKKVKVQVWDTCGQESFKSITRSYYRGSCCVLLVYDITRRASFEHVATWLEECRQYGGDKMVGLLVGNKTDRDQARMVSYDEGEKFAKENDLFFIETSAKTNTNVDEAFVITARAVLDKIAAGEIDVNDDACGVKPSGKAATGGTGTKPVDVSAATKPADGSKGGCGC